jgi:hypothetical protein
MEILDALGAIPGLAPLLPGLLALNVWVIAPSLHPPGEFSWFLYRAIYRFSTVLAGNYGHAANATDPKVKK